MTSDKTIATDSKPDARTTRKRATALIWLVVLYLVLDRAVYYVLYRTPGFNLVGRAVRDQEYLRDHPDVRKILIVGDSRLRWTMDPREISKAMGWPEQSGLNITLPTAQIRDDLAVFQWLRNKGYSKDVKILIWGVALDRFNGDLFAQNNIHIFYDPWARGNSFISLTDWATRWGMPGLASHSLVRELGSNWHDNPERRPEMYEQLLHYTPKDYNELGFLKSHKPVDTRVDPKPGWGQKQYGKQFVQPEHVKMLVDEVARLRADGIRVVVLDPPIAPRLMSHFKEERPDAWESFENLLVKMQQAGAEVIRQSEVGPFNRKVDFSDDLHLSGDADPTDPGDRYLKSVIRRIATPKQN